MMKCSVTISLVPQAHGGPFVFQGSLDRGLATSASLGFHAVELFLPCASSVNRTQLNRKLRTNGLTVSALGTGAGFLNHGWTLCSFEASVRRRASQFISEMICLGADLGAPVIIGSMKGSVSSKERRDVVSARLIESLALLAEKAQAAGTKVLLEPLNRYETNLVNRLDEGTALLAEIANDHLRILADLFHMNIEEESVSQALRQADKYLGYLHFVDNNRRAAGFGSLDFASLAAVLREIQYEGFLSAEALPYPDPEQAARKTIETYHRYFQPLRQEETI